MASVHNPSPPVALMTLTSSKAGLLGDADLAEAALHRAGWQHWIGRTPLADIGPRLVEWLDAEGGYTPPPADLMDEAAEWLGAWFLATPELAHLDTVQALWAHGLRGAMWSQVFDHVYRRQEHEVVLWLLEHDLGPTQCPPFHGLMHFPLTPTVHALVERLVGQFEQPLRDGQSPMASRPAGEAWRVLSQLHCTHAVQLGRPIELPALLPAAHYEAWGQWLVRLGQDPNLPYHHPHAPDPLAEYAVFTHPYPEVIVRQGARVDVRDALGQGVWHHAAQSVAHCGPEMVLDAWRRLGVDPRMTCMRGRTALHAYLQAVNTDPAALAQHRDKHVHALATLLRAGVDPEVLDHAGKRPWQVAQGSFAADPALLRALLEQAQLVGSLEQTLATEGPQPKPTRVRL